MTVGELIEVDNFCTLLTVTVRENGHGMWKHRYRIGKDAPIYASETWEGHPDHWGHTERLPAGAKETVFCGPSINGNLIMTVYSRDVQKTPKDIKALKVCCFVPRRLKGYDGGLDHELDVNCYPDGYVSEHDNEPDQAAGQLEGQMNISEWMGQ